MPLTKSELQAALASPSAYRAASVLVVDLVRVWEQMAVVLIRGRRQELTWAHEWTNECGVEQWNVGACNTDPEYTYCVFEPQPEDCFPEWDYFAGLREEMQRIAGTEAVEMAGEWRLFWDGEEVQ
jgi:hypothetical protein